MDGTLPVGWIQGHGTGFVQIDFNHRRAHRQRRVAQENQLFAVVEEVPIVRRPVQCDLTHS